MATDATGTPTTLGIPTYNINVDAPSGNGNTAQMQAIDSLIGLRAPLASPALTGTPTAPSAAVDTNTGQIATTAFVLGQAASATPLIDGTAAVGTSTRYARADHVHPTDTTRAPLASPTFTGTPAAPTPLTADNSTTIATTAFVKAQGYLTSNLVTSVHGRTGAVVSVSGDYTAAQVTNAADKSSGSTQAFTGSISSAGAISTSSPTAGFGYTTGAGSTGSQTQALAFSTGITMGKTAQAGQLTVTSMNLANASAFTLKVNNVSAGTSDTVVATVEGADAGSVICSTAIPSSGVLYITFYNVSGGAVTSNLVVNFAVVNGATS